MGCSGRLPEARACLTNTFDSWKNKHLEEEIPYSQFLKYLEQHQVDKTVVADNSRVALKEKNMNPEIGGHNTN